MVRKRDSKDFDRLKHAARLMAKMGREVVILPEINVKNPLYLQIFGENNKHYPNKCPDMIVDGKFFYEHKGYTTKNPKKQADNMLTNALSQSSRVIIEECETSPSDIHSLIQRKIYSGFNVDEVWMAKKDTLNLFYKKNPD